MSHPDPEPTPEQEARVRRLLAQARPDPRNDTRDALPLEVAERLDATLRELSAPALDPATAPAEVTPLTARRRRRVAGGLLAAAAVVVAAVGIGQVVDLGGSSSGGDASTASVDSGEGAERGAVGGGAAEPEAAEELDDSAEGPDAPLDRLAPDPSDGAPPLAGSGDRAVPSAPIAAVVEVRVRVRQFSTDAERVRAALGPQPQRNQYTAPAQRRLPTELRTRRVFECGSTALGPGVWVGVVYAGSPGVLVFRRPVGDAQVADLVQCGTGEILRSTTLPVAPRR